MVAAAYPRRGGRGAPSRLPMLRLDVVVVLLLLFFLVGLFVPSLIGSSSKGEARALSLFTPREAPVSAEEWEDLQEEVSALGERLAAAEKESKAVLEENARLRLDNKVEQSNLKSLTKAKNEEIKRLTAEVEELKKQQPAGGDAGTAAAECQKQKQELEGTVQSLQKELEEARAATKRAEEQAAKAGAGGAGAAGLGKGDDDDDDFGKTLKEEEEEAREMEEKATDGGKGKAAAAGASSSSFLSKQLISVPEPQPLNGYWEPRVKELFYLVRGDRRRVYVCIRARPSCLPDQPHVQPTPTTPCPQALSDPAKLLQQLDEADPLGVNVESVEAFACPVPAERLTQPDLRRMEIAAQFREGKGFVFFQHLRKAGGTGFCDLAARSMPGKTPAYYCMPDQRGTLATPPWNTSWLLDTMAARGFRIAANEWDAFPRSKFAMAVRLAWFGCRLRGSSRDQPPTADHPPVPRPIHTNQTN